MNLIDYYALASKPVETCLVGSGSFGRSFLSQGLRVPLMRARIAVDREPSIAAAVFIEIGIAATDIALCTTAEQAMNAWKQGQYIAAADLSLVAGLPIDVIVEATGDPEAGARHANTAIEAGRHLVMVSKEADSVVGPFLAHLAKLRGKVVTPVDGDQPSLLIGLVTWAQTLGFEIIAAGKSSEYDFVYDESAGTVTSNGVTIMAPGFEAYWDLGSRPVAEVVRERSQACALLEQRVVPDLCELLVVANSTGFRPDCVALHAPIARISEVPTILGPIAEGGLLGQINILDAFHCLRRPDEISFAGGVFVIIRCDDARTWQLLADKGHIVSRDNRRAMVFLPRHLLGLEAATSVLDAAVHGRSSGSQNPHPELDLVARATRHLHAGTVLTARGSHHTIEGTTGELWPARPLDSGNPVPFYLVANRTLVREVKVGALITLSDIEIDPASTLLELRKQQDEYFFAGGAHSA